MDQQFNPPNKSIKKFNRKWFFIGVTLVILVGGYFLFASIPSVLPGDLPGEQTREKFSTGLSGKLYLSLTPKGSQHVDLYTLNVADSSIEKHTRDGLVSYMEVVSHTGDKTAFFAKPLAPDKNLTGELSTQTLFQLYTQDLNTGDLVPRTDEAYDAARSPQWSPEDDRIAFTSRISPDPNRRWEPDNWMIHIYNLEVDTITDIGVGTNPMWSPDGQHIFVLRNDGLYSYDPTNERSAERVLTSSGMTSANMKLGLSNNDTPLLLAWTSAEVMRIWQFGQDENGLDTFTFVREIKIKGLSAFWPVFSPDDKFIAIQLADLLTDGGIRNNPRIIVIDIESEKWLELFGLEDFNFNSAFNSDWR